MSFLLDTNVLSELRKGPRCDRNVARWLSAVDDDDLHTSVVVLGELARGIERVRSRDPVFAGQLEQWLRRTVEAMAERILPIDRAVALRWGRITAPRTVPPIDGLLAATAMVHGLVLVTRNVRDVADLGVSHLNPFEPSPR